MEFGEKLQKLRKQKGLTQEELASLLFVSRTAVSKWEAGRGYPSIDSLKAIAKCFSVTIDELLSSKEILVVAEENGKEQAENLRGLVFGALDLSSALFMFLPLFRQIKESGISAVNLLSLSNGASHLKFLFCALIFAMMVSGAWMLLKVLFRHEAANKKIIGISFSLNMLAVTAFALGLHPYAAVLMFFFTVIKSIMLLKKP